MSAESLSKIGNTSGSGQSFDSSAGKASVFWRSEQTILQPTSYVAHTPPGLHLGCGVASIETRSAGFGEFALNGAGLTAMLCPEGAQPFHSRVSGRSARACGLFLATDDIADTGSDAVHEIKLALEKGNPLQASSNAPLGVVSRLCAPVDPWFQGAARELVFEARAFEMSALALTWLCVTCSTGL